MAEDINPITRFFVIAAMLITPILVVILQRLPDIREIIQRYKDGDTSFDLKSLFITNNFNEASHQSQKRSSICPKCYKINPPDHQYCGYCGAEIKPLRQGDEK
jgi:ribosomal protein L40E